MEKTKDLETRIEIQKQLLAELNKELEAHKSSNALKFEDFALQDQGDYIDLTVNTPTMTYYVLRINLRDGTLMRYPSLKCSGRPFTFDDQAENRIAMREADI